MFKECITHYGPCLSLPFHLGIMRIPCSPFCSLPKEGGFIQLLSQTFEARGPITFDQIFSSFEVLEQEVLGPLEGRPDGEDSNSHTA